MSLFDLDLREAVGCLYFINFFYLAQPLSPPPSPNFYPVEYCANMQ